MQKHLYIETWGCQMNRHQSEGIAGLLEEHGLFLTDSLALADVVIFNTCMVRQKAEEKVYGRIGAIVEQKKKRPVLLGIGGCMPQVHGESLLRRFPAIDFLFGSSDLAALPSLIDEIEGRKGRIAHLPSPIGIDEVPFRRESMVTAMVTITQGCSNSCSYCIVPRACGPLRSRPAERIVAEVNGLLTAGCREVLLLGQNADSYGRDRPEFGDFAGLLAQVAATEIPRIRFTSSHPRDMTEQVIETIAAHGNICNHIHLACQSGSDRILQAMNRGYTCDQFLTIVNAAQRMIPEVNITTDLIVGYPGESESDFCDTVRLIEEVRFGSIFVATYSPRPGTHSATLSDDVAPVVKGERLQEILSRQRAIAFEENLRQIGQTVTVLILGRTAKGAFYGRSEDHRTVIISGDVEIGEFVPVRIETASAAALVGQPAVLSTVKGAR
ncbi:tRNA (N6-isopentenyl adenosine(37)-C2)-methylthiotransferase MiaB [Candidatus Bipolaricaulota bacterium]|nr:tRNA (N6-isopentenyl adenosine(37)-C2)-methylthiotransferase MiaB [Candidatus Bipolaricaulota bacterium]